MHTTHTPTYPQAWSTEMIRNDSGRAFWFVSRFVSRTTVEYVQDVSGKPQCFRLERKAIVEAAHRNTQASLASV